MSKEQRRIRIYVSYPYSDEPERRIKEVEAIVKEVMSIRNGFVLFIPHFAFHAFNSTYGVEIADEHCLELLKVSDMLLICLPKYSRLSRGMQIEAKYAKEHNKPIIYLSDFLRNPHEVLKENRNLLQVAPSIE